MVAYHCVVPENIHTSPTEGSVPKTPHPSVNSNKASHISLNFWILQNPPPSQEIPFPSVGVVWIFSGSAHSGKNLEISVQSQMKKAIISIIGDYLYR